MQDVVSIVSVEVGEEYTLAHLERVTQEERQLVSDVADLSASAVVDVGSLSEPVLQSLVDALDGLTVAVYLYVKVV